MKPERGRWICDTGGLVTRHRSKRAARAKARRYANIGGRVGRYHRKNIVLDGPPNAGGISWLRSSHFGIDLVAAGKAGAR